MDGTGPFLERGDAFQQTFLFVPLAELQESTSNPRRHFDAKGLDDLAESIRNQGVLSPLLVRPILVRGLVGDLLRYEVVCGARRYRAAKLAVVPAVPVRVVQLTDDQVLELQVVENLQREGVHPMDEALGYEALKRRGYSSIRIAAKVGKSVSYVDARLRFTDLGPVARDAFLEGKLSPSVALLVARIPHVDLQAKAVKEILQDERRPDHTLTVFEVRRLIEHDYMRSLKGCQFPVSSAQLLPAAGPCTTCPKRTGSQRELFDDVDSPDVCTDPKCFAKKQDAWWRQQATAHAAMHGKDSVVDQKEAPRYLHYGSGYVDLESPCYQAGCNGQPWAKVLKSYLGELALVLVRDPEKGTVHRMALETQAKKALRAAQVAAGVVPEKTEDQKERQRREKAKLEQAFRRELLRTLFAQAPPGAGAPQPPGVTSEDLITIACAMFAARSYPEVVGLLALEASMGEQLTAAELKARDPRDPEAFEDAIRDLNDAKVMRLLLALAVAPDTLVSPWSLEHEPEGLAAVCKRYGMSIDALRPSYAAKAKAPKSAKGKAKTRRAA